mgnify:CR=1 FL=1
MALRCSAEPFAKLVVEWLLDVEGARAVVGMTRPTGVSRTRGEGAGA